MSEVSLRSVVFFNNKGGVGKTTLACNVASFLTIKHGASILLIDADPQCNSTELILGEDTTEEIYTGSKKFNTLYDILEPIEFGEPSIATTVVPVPRTANRFQLDLIPGHPKLSIVEDRLSEAWSGVLGGDIGGFRITNWCFHLLQILSDQYDLIIFDVGPSLGALNRTVLLASDYIVTPFGCDIFSLIGIQNISTWIQNWKRQYTRSVTGAKEDSPTIFSNFELIDDPETRFRFAGYSVQQYVTRKFAKGPRAVKSYDRILSQIPETVSQAMRFITPERLSHSDLELGHIPFLYSLVPMAQSAKCPIHALTSSDGVVGNQYAQVKLYGDLMGSLCKKLLVNVGLA